MGTENGLFLNYFIPHHQIKYKENERKKIKEAEGLGTGSLFLCRD